MGGFWHSFEAQLGRIAPEILASDTQLLQASECVSACVDFVAPARMPHFPKFSTSTEDQLVNLINIGFCTAVDMACMAASARLAELSSDQDTSGQ